MLRSFFHVTSLLIFIIASCRSSRAQLPPVKNPLAPAQNSAAAGCSTTDASSCAQVAAKLLPIVMGPSPMEENLRRLADESGDRGTGTLRMGEAIAWAVAAFRAAGIDVHTESYTFPRSSESEIDKIQVLAAREDAMHPARAVAAYTGRAQTLLHIGGPVEQENVVGEIRGYEKPDEAVILGAHLDPRKLGDCGCNAALVIEASRAIKATGLLPRRTIRFVLFSGDEQGAIGSYEYVKAHHPELDKIRAMIVFDAGNGRVTGYSLGGRRDMEAGVREVLKPLESWGANNHTYDAFSGADNFDFLLEGVPTLVANQEEANYLPNHHAASDKLYKVDMRELKLRTVIAALTAWGIADRTEPLGKRLSRSEIEVQMKETGLDQQMKTLGYWDTWQSGARGRRP